MEDFYPYFFDLFIIVILVICVLHGCKKGFLSMFTAFIGRIIAFVLALLICTTASAMVYNNFISKSINEKINEKVSAVLLADENSSVSTLIDKATEDMPEFIHKTAMSYADKLTVEKNDVNEISDAIEKDIVAPIITSALDIAIFVILLTIFLIVVKCLSKAFKGANDLPVIGELNKFLGALLGVVNAFIIVVVSAFILKAVVFAVGNDSKIFNEETINKSVAYNYVYTIPSFDKGE